MGPGSAQWRQAALPHCNTVLNVAAHVGKWVVWSRHQTCNISSGPTVHMFLRIAASAYQQQTELYAHQSCSTALSCHAFECAALALTTMCMTSMTSSHASSRLQACCALQWVRASQ